jgi:hypothetical protein
MQQIARTGDEKAPLSWKLAAFNMPRRDLFALIGLAWLANQIIGYGFLAYPQTWDSFAWRQSAQPRCSPPQ